VKNKKKEMEKE